MRLAALAVFVLACGGESSGTVVEVPPQPLPASPPPVTVAAEAPPAQPMVPMRAGEDWVGTYTCAQGRTDLALHVGGVSGQTIDAVFDFSHAPSGAAGAFEMHGSITPDGHVALSPGSWIRQPSGYDSVGMHGEVRGSSFVGRIDNPSCGNFSLRRRRAY